VLCAAPAHADSGWAAIANSPSREAADYSWSRARAAAAEAQAVHKCLVMENASDCRVLASGPNCAAIAWDGDQPLNHAPAPPWCRPVVLLAATHSVAVLVRTHAGGFTYWCALLMTLALASCAFVLSFDALRSLAVTLGLPESIAWLWPCAIDVAIAQATPCLLSLSRREGAAPQPGQSPSMW
jgi:hypothetical protein